MDDQYLFGNDLVVAPVTRPGATEREVFLPSGSNWTEAYTGAVHQGGVSVSAAAPLAVIPVFVREDADPILLQACSRVRSVV